MQLGFTRTGDPILFIAQVRAQLQENDLYFSDRGVGVTAEQLALLEPVQVFAEPIPAGICFPPESTDMSPCPLADLRRKAWAAEARVRVRHGESIWGVQEASKLLARGSRSIASRHLTPGGEASIQW